MQDAVKPMLDQAKFDKTKQKVCFLKKPFSFLCFEIESFGIFFPKKVSDFLSDVVLVQEVEAYLKQRREEEENWVIVQVKRLQFGVHCIVELSQSMLGSRYRVFLYVQEKKIYYCTY